MSAKLKEFGFINSYDTIFEYLSEKRNETDVRNYFISISGYGELICFGYENKMIIASLNYSIHSKNSDNVNFTVNSREIVSEKYLEDNISSILVIPIASQKQSSQGFPDWTCICVGFTSGRIRFYDQCGQLLFTQKLHSSRIDKIQVHISPCQNSPEIFSENLMVLCGNCCFQIDGFHLYDSLNMFKKQLARQQAGFVDCDLEMFQLQFKKWLIESQENVADIVFGNETSDCVLDNIYMNASNKGPFASVPDQVSKYINCATAGRNPFVAFYRLPLDSDSLDMADLAQAVYSKVKGAISTSFSSWLGSSRTSNKSAVPKKSGTSNSDLPSRFQLRHSIEECSRKSSMIIGCPQHNTYSRLAAMTDDFGRIFLIDIDDGVIVRIWKGYRDAQISITTSSTDRNVNFLLIYAPRRGLIEIWTIPFGERVASFDVRDRNGRLIHVPHGLLGLSRCQKFNQKLRHCHSTFFLDSSGKISVLEIPFHLSLVNSSNERSQDHLVLKHFKNFLRDKSSKPDPAAIKTEFSVSIRPLKLTGSVELLIHSIISVTYLPIELLISLFDEIIELISSDTIAQSSSENERGRLKKTCSEILLLINCYKRITEMSLNEMLPKEEHNLEILLNLENEDCIRMKKLFELYCKYHKTISCQSSENESYRLLTNNFASLPITGDGSLSSFQLTKAVLDKDVLNIGCFIFQKCVTGEYSIEMILGLIINDTKIDQMSCFKICMTYLIHESVDVIMNNLVRIKQLLSALLISQTTNSDTNLFVRDAFLRNCFNLSYDICEKSPRLMTALLLSMVIRVLICEFMQDISDNDSHKFVTYLTESLLSWNDTCQRLEDLSIFSCLLKCRPVIDDAIKINKAKVSFDRDLTLAHVMENGKGIFSESFAKWAFKWSLTFSDINELYKSLGDGSLDYDIDRSKEEFNLNMEIKEIFFILYKQLPHSLEYDSILMNVAWEYTRLWSKTIQRIKYLQCACELLENVGPAGGLVIQGIGGMMWDMHIRTGLESLVSDEKTEASRYSSEVIVNIVTNAIRFLQIVSKSLENIDVVPTSCSEPVWNGDKSRSSLIEMAIAKDPVTPDAVEIHIQLLNALQLVALVDLHNVNCKILYSSETRKYFFESITKIVPPEVINCDIAQCKSHRMRFIERVVSSCTKIFGEGTEDNFLCQTVHAIIKILAEKWQMNLEDIRQCWILNYYKCGLDSQAAMYLDTVSNTTLMAAGLLKILGSRVKKDYLCPGSKNYREYSRYVTPQLNRWFQSLDNTIVKKSSLQQNAILIDQILEWLPENSFDFESATCLQSLILNIEKTQKYLE